MKTPEQHSGTSHTKPDRAVPAPPDAVNRPARLGLIDALKALGSQLIVLHHLAFYGPMSDHARPLFPSVLSWLYEYGRMSVQIFLVLGGFLAAQALARHGTLIDQSPATLLGQRYRKLSLPYFVALAIAILAAALARQWMTHEATPAVPTLSQIVAHALLLQSILGFEGLSAGVWYIAIDFQLYALLLALLWLARKIPGKAEWTGPFLVSVLMAGSLFIFNRSAHLDLWGLYFFGSYALGALAYWASRDQTKRWWYLVVPALAILALLADFRLRIAIALTTACVLAQAGFTGFLQRWPGWQLTAWLGRISYSVFLVHYPVCLLVNAVFEAFIPHTPGAQGIGILVGWAASTAAGAAFFSLVEARTARVRR